MIISNPYIDIGSKVRHKAISHEHTWVESTPLFQKYFERAINRRIDVMAGVSYQPCLPSVPATGFSCSYEDWEFVLDENDNITYELDSQGNKKTKRYNGHDYYIPVLRRITKTYSNHFVDFEMQDGNMSDIANLVQLPNCEHAFFVMPDGKVNGALHLNFLGSNWGEAVNGSLPNIDKYNSENNYNLSAGAFRQIFPLWTIEQVLQNVRNNLMFQNKVFGTINHPGYTSLKDSAIETLLSLGSDIFKAMEIYNHGDDNVQASYNITCYDRTLMKDHRLWLVAVSDWGATKETDYHHWRGESCGCNLLYLSSSYESATLQEKAEMALDAYIAGSFSGAGFGTLDLTDVSISGNRVTVTFNDVPDNVIVDIDGERTTVSGSRTVFANLEPYNTFVRFEAFKGTDFLFTQPFFVLDRQEKRDLKKIMAVFGD